MILKRIKAGDLGKHVGHVYTIEFQKRGLPHVHILIFLAPEARIHDAAMIDKVISAQIPDPETHPRLHALVTKMMVHNPCGDANPNAPCMKDGKCSKGYPKEFVEETSLAHDGYAIYARPNNGRTFTTANGTVIDNRWIVPYCPLLILLLEWRSLHSPTYSGWIPGGFRSENRNPTGISGIQVFFFWCNCHYIDQFRVQFLQPESPESDGTQKLINKPDTGFRAVWPFRHLGISVGTVTPSLKRLYFY